MQNQRRALVGLERGALEETSMMQSILKMVVAGAVVLLVAGCSTEQGSGSMAVNGPARLGAGDAVGQQLYTPVTGVYAARAAAQDVKLAGVRQDE
jgi:hypothetical protein